jgi:glucosamine-6-phosphate deaminase
VELSVFDDPAALGEAAATLWLDRVAARPGLVLAAPAGRTPRPMYRRLREEAHRRGSSFRDVRVFAADELCKPAPADGYFWRQIREGFLDWAGVPPAHRYPFDPWAEDLDAMCREVERAIAEAGGLDLVTLGLGPNGHLAANEPGSPFDSRTRPVVLHPETVAYMATDAGPAARVWDRAVTLGLGTIAAAREVVVLVSGPLKRDVLRRALAGPVDPGCPASLLQTLPGARVLADRAAAGRL